MHFFRVFHHHPFLFNIANFIQWWWKVYHQWIRRLPCIYLANGTIQRITSTSFTRIKKQGLICLWPCWRIYSKLPYHSLWESFIASNTAESATDINTKGTQSTANSFFKMVKKERRQSYRQDSKSHRVLWSTRLCSNCSHFCARKNKTIHCQVKARYDLQQYAIESTKSICSKQWYSLFFFFFVFLCRRRSLFRGTHYYYCRLSWTHQGVANRLWLLCKYSHVTHCWYPVFTSSFITIGATIDLFWCSFHLIILIAQDSEKLCTVFIAPFEITCLYLGILLAVYLNKICMHHQ